MRDRRETSIPMGPASVKPTPARVVHRSYGAGDESATPSWSSPPPLRQRRPRTPGRHAWKLATSETSAARDAQHAHVGALAVPRARDEPDTPSPVTRRYAKATPPKNAGSHAKRLAISDTLSPATLNTRTWGPPPGPAPVMSSDTPSALRPPAATATPPAKPGCDERIPSSRTSDRP